MGDKMFIDIKLKTDPGMAAIEKIISGGLEDQRIGKGQFLCGHWSLHYSFPGWHEGCWEAYNDIEIDGQWFGSYGVCDSPEQFMEKIGKHLEASSDKYVVCFVKIRKDEQSPSGGWRWHKWGEYIGKQEPQCEYIYDEPVIEEVYTYHFYKKVK